MLSFRQLFKPLLGHFNPFRIISERDECLKVSYGFGILTLFFVGKAPVEICLSQVGVQLDGLVAVGNGQVPLSHFEVHVGSVNVVLNVIGVQLDGLAVVGYG